MNTALLHRPRLDESVIQVHGQRGNSVMEGLTINYIWIFNSTTQSEVCWLNTEMQRSSRYREQTINYRQIFAGGGSVPQTLICSGINRIYY